MTQRALTFLRRCRSHFVHWYWPAKYEYSVFCFPGSSHWPQTPPQSGRPTSWFSIFCSISHQYLSIWQLRDIVNTEKIIIWNKYLITTPRTRAFLREMFCFSNIIPAHPYFLYPGPGLLVMTTFKCEDNNVGKYLCVWPLKIWLHFSQNTLYCSLSDNFMCDQWSCFPPGLY